MQSPYGIANWRLSPGAAFVFGLIWAMLGVVGMLPFFFFDPVSRGQWAGVLVCDGLGLAAFGFGIFWMVKAGRVLAARYRARRESCTGWVTGFKAETMPGSPLPAIHLTYGYVILGEGASRQGMSPPLSLRQLERWRIGDPIQVCPDPFRPAFSFPDLGEHPRSAIDRALLDPAQKEALRRLLGGRAALWFRFAFFAGIIGAMGVAGHFHRDPSGGEGDRRWLGGLAFLALALILLACAVRALRKKARYS
ncbi:hypothetical protein SAMN05444156_1221 [Verrucomicrobium sp. GAS474]|uniref:hypothetical protein n=1 Tax=Verrucomicrobium sp. GAS474 TaxID=1882831 RepID=UPI0008798995|nr:hypothetical protein [Verrucomicrobium sp. GAS474]SDT97968.1 hypothetical protein SAMN05444156_1221 [Verrucomicrobium sp. GAS474]